MIEFEGMRIRRADRYNWVIETPEEKTSKEGATYIKWEIRGYYGNMVSLLQCLPLVYLNTQEKNTLQEILTTIQEFKNEALQILKLSDLQNKRVEPVKNKEGDQDESDEPDPVEE